MWAHDVSDPEWNTVLFFYIVFLSSRFCYCLSPGLLPNNANSKYSIRFSL